MSVNFHPRVAVLTAAGNHLRYVPRAFAEALVAGGSAHPERTVGRVRTVVLARPATAYAQRIGGPSDARVAGVRFYRWVHLDVGARIVEHHPRCTETQPDA